MLVGTLLLLLVVVRRVRSPLLLHFAIQTAAWGAVDLAIALVGRAGATDRDLSAAVRLDRFIWLNTGLDIGYVAVGLTLALTGWFAARRLGPVGAGTAIVVQGLALLILDLRFLLQLQRLV